MKLIEALQIVGRPCEGAELRVALACGFMPLHLKTFLAAELQQAYPSRAVSVSTGMYGDLVGALRDLAPDTHAVAAVIEWADLDPRLGIRQLGGWAPNCLASIVERAAMWLEHAARLIVAASARVPVVVSLPTLPLPPLFYTAGVQSGAIELRLREHVAAFAARIAAERRVRVVNGERLNRISPPSSRLSVKGEWSSGFPYETAHAAALGAMLARLIRDPLPKKGLVTDLDDTLWRGIVGDVGVAEIAWDLDHNAQAHGFYQQMLRCLAEEGVLVGVASKNDPEMVRTAFARTDLLLPAERVFPFEVSWGSKAVAVARVLEQWNIGADSVVFVDDNPMELAEVERAHPGIETALFDSDPAAVYALCERLRDHFGRTTVLDEDRLRLDSLRRAAVLRGEEPEEDGFSEALLETAEGELTLRFAKDSADARAFELVNKTNQFNLNGRRYTEAEWNALLADPAAFVVTAAYRDRFGTLGKIAVLAGRVDTDAVRVDTWVLSCRAFARRIEHHCVRALFERFQPRPIELRYAGTARNGPTTRFLTELLGAPPAGPCAIEQTRFENACPRLFHRVNIVNE